VIRARKEESGMTRAEALAKVGKRVVVHDLVDGDGKSWARYAQALPVGTTRRVIHANHVHRVLAAEGGSAPVDTYEGMIAREVPDHRRDTCDQRDDELFITALA
jgi:hypothetical protein